MKRKLNKDSVFKKKTPLLTISKLIYAKEYFEFTLCLKIQLINLKKRLLNKNFSFFFRIFRFYDVLTFEFIIVLGITKKKSKTIQIIFHLFTFIQQVITIKKSIRNKKKCE